MPNEALDTRDLIYDVLRPLAREKGVELTETTDFLGDLDLDSMTIMEVLLELEERLDILIPQNVLPDVRTLRDLARELDALKPV